MEKIKFRVSGNQIEVLERPAVITAGTVGITAEFSFDDQWDNLAKTAVFKAGEKVTVVTLTGGVCVVPWEVLEKPNQWLCVGVYGANGMGTVVIPTLWAKISVIHAGADPEGDPALEPSAPVWQETLYLAQRNATTVAMAVGSLAPILCPEHESPTLATVMSALADWDRHNEDLLSVHTNNKENPHEVTCEQIGAVTKEQHDADIQDAKDAAQLAEDKAMEEIETQVDSIHELFPTRAEVDAAMAENKAVIVTVNGTTPSHTSQEIYALIQAGKVVYLQLWGNTYVICSACTESEAKFENSVVTTATGADGKTYNVQRFRLYFIKNDRYAAQQTIESPSIEYLDAAIAALNQ